MKICNLCNRQFKHQNGLNSHVGLSHNKTYEQRKEYCLKGVETKHRLNIPLGTAKLETANKVWEARRKNGTDKCPQARIIALRGWERRRREGRDKLTQEEIKKRLRRHPISSLETRMNEIVQKYNLPYKFVGNGEFFIERKVPDFVHTGDKKIVIEVYCRKHKDMFRGGWEQWIIDREKLFAQHGYKTFFFDPTQLKDEQEIVKQLEKVNENKEINSKKFNKRNNC